MPAPPRVQLPLIDKGQNHQNTWSNLELSPRRHEEKRRKGSTPNSDWTGLNRDVIIQKAIHLTTYQTYIVEVDLNP